MLALMNMKQNNIILIGMAAAGKSTIGRYLGAALHRPFVDTDQLMEAWWGASLQAIRDQLGLTAFMQAEAEQVLRIDLKNCVIATGGSVVYSSQAMEHFQAMGQIVYLYTDFEVIAQRLTNPKSRGLAMRPGQSLRELYAERAPLYAQYAQLTINSQGSPQEICAQIMTKLSVHDQENS